MAALRMRRLGYHAHILSPAPLRGAGESKYASRRDLVPLGLGAVQHIP
jgi:hypothetical protein